MSEAPAGYEVAPVAGDRWGCGCGADLWAEAKFCPLCGTGRGAGVADGPGPLELRLAAVLSEVDALQRELAHERDVRETKVGELTRAVLAKDGEVQALRAAVAEGERRMADAAIDSERLARQIARLKRPGAHWLGPLVAGGLAGLLLGAVVSGVFDGGGGGGGGEAAGRIVLGEAWVPLDLPEGSAVTLSAGAAFRVRGPDGLFVVEPGEAVRLPKGGAEEARAVAGRVELSVAPAD